MTEKFPTHMMSLADVADQLKSGTISSTQLTKTILARISACDRHYKAYAQVIESESLQAAANADEDMRAGNYKGVLQGIPVAVKDLFYMEGTDTAVGSKIFSGYASTSNAEAVNRLRRAGAIIIGKLNMSEFALSGYHPEKQVPINPWNENFWSGVS
ncbi:MAG: amidase, partial [Gammaproteobacteria bacterium]|nr:amidase [Gammaproteobacteria bacterium]